MIHLDDYAAKVAFARGTLSTLLAAIRFRTKASSIIVFSQFNTETNALDFPFWVPCELAHMRGMQREFSDIYESDYTTLMVHAPTPCVEPEFSRCASSLMLMAAYECVTLTTDYLYLHTFMRCEMDLHAGNTVDLEIPPQFQVDENAARESPSVQRTKRCRIIEIVNSEDRANHLNKLLAESPIVDHMMPIQ